MNYKVLYRKYRPNDFANVVGQEYTIEMLKNAISTGKHAHAYIFTGPRGTGKTSSAKVFAKALNCENPIDGNPCNKCPSCLSFKDNTDIIEIDAASNNGVDQIRELINNVKLVPSSSKYKIYIIDEVHMLTDNAFNALLLTLEEPPSHVVFILATTDIQKVPITILSRCQRFDFKPVNKEALINRLDFVCKEENIAISSEALEEIALISAGGMRDALGMLDQLSNTNEEISLEMVSNYFGSVSVKRIDELLTAIENNNSDTLLNVLGNIKDNGTNYSVFIEKLISELRKIAIEIKSGKGNHNISFDSIYNMILDLNECLTNVSLNIDPYILIEIVLLKYINTSKVVNNKEYFPGNNESDKLVTQEVATGNKNSDSSVNVGNNSTVVQDKDEPEKDNRVVDDSIDDAASEETFEDSPKFNVDVDVRINNCFVDASKEYKNKLSDSWVDFMNYLMKKDRSLISLLADTSVLTASNKYAIIQSKIESTNDLINGSILKLEGFYEDFSGNKLKFAAANEKIWKDATEKYRFNLKNKIKYSYIDENIEVLDDTESVQQVVELDNLESIAEDIFGSYEVEN